MDAHNTLQLLLDANTHVLTAIYTRPPRPVAAETALPAGENDANEDANASDEDAERAGDAAWPATCPTGTAWPPPPPNRAGPPKRWTTTPSSPSSTCRDAVAPVQGTIGKVQDGSYELERAPTAWRP